MLYGLLIEGVIVEQQEPATLQANDAAAEEESAWLGMDAWVCCECAQMQPVA